MLESFTLQSLKIAPETSPIEDPVKLTLNYGLSENPTNWEWILKYTVDIAFKRITLELSHEKIADAGKAGVTNVKEIVVPKLPIEGISKKDLMNIGLLSISGMNNGKEMALINIVCQITKSEKGELMKTLLSPLN